MADFATPHLRPRNLPRPTSTPQERVVVWQSQRHTCHTLPRRTLRRCGNTARESGKARASSSPAGPSSAAPNSCRGFRALATPARDRCAPWPPFRVAGSRLQARRRTLAECIASKARKPLGGLLRPGKRGIGPEACSPCRTWSARARGSPSGARSAIIRRGRSRGPRLMRPSRRPSAWRSCRPSPTSWRSPWRPAISGGSCRAGSRWVIRGFGGWSIRRHRGLMPSFAEALSGIVRRRTWLRTNQARSERFFGVTSATKYRAIRGAQCPAGS